MSRRLKIVIAAAVALVVLVVGGPFVYIHFIEDPPDKLTLDSTTGSEAGYRVKEVLFGQDNTAVGRTSDVTGSLVLEGTTISSAKVVVDMTTVSSDRSQRDSQFKGRIMDVATFPTASFELTKPIVLASVPTDGEKITAKTTGKLTLHGTTKVVTFDLNAVRTGATIKVQGSIPIHFVDYGIDNPGGGPAKVGDDGELEFLVVFPKG